MTAEQTVEAREQLAFEALKERGYTYAGFGEWRGPSGELLMSQTASALVSALVRREARQAEDMRQVYYYRPLARYNGEVLHCAGCGAEKDEHRAFYVPYFNTHLAGGYLAGVQLMRGYRGNLITADTHQEVSPEYYSRRYAWRGNEMTGNGHLERARLGRYVFVFWHPYSDAWGLVIKETPSYCTVRFANGATADYTHAVLVDWQ